MAYKINDIRSQQITESQQVVRPQQVQSQQVTPSQQRFVSILTAMSLVIGIYVGLINVSEASWHDDNSYFMTLSSRAEQHLPLHYSWSDVSLTQSDVVHDHTSQLAQGEPIPTFPNSFEQQDDAPSAPVTIQQGGREPLLQQPQQQQTLNVLLEQVLLINQRLTSIEQQLSQFKQGSLATTSQTNQQQQLPVIDAGSSQPNGAQVLSSQQTPTVTDQARENRAKNDYSQALELLRKRKFSDAETALKSFINAYQDSSLLSNAQYWLGETFYAQNQFEEAIKVFLRSLEINPNSNKANDILLKLGLSFKALSRKDKACESFAPLIYGSRNPAIYISDRAKIESLGLGCPQ